MAKTMKALVQRFDGYTDRPEGPQIADARDWLELAEIPVPKPGPGQALIRVIRAAVNPSDLHFIKGEYGQPRVKGRPAGFEGVGEVVDGDTPLKGQRVAFYATHSGTWAEYALTDASGLIPCHPDLADKDAAGLIVNPMTAMAMFGIVREDGAKSFVLTAAGSQLGKLLIALGRDAGVAPIAVVRRAAQAEALKALGAARVVVTGEDGWLPKAEATLKTQEPRILLDAVGDQAAADLFFAMPKGARWISYGKLSSEAPRLTQMGQFIFMGKRIEGFWLTQWFQTTPPEVIGKAIAEVQERFITGAWTTDVTAEIPLDRALDELAPALQVKDGKVQILP